MRSWIERCRAGAPGETARTLTKLYYTFKQQHPEASESELCKMLIQMRINIGVLHSREQRARLELSLKHLPGSLEMVVQEIVKIESNIWSPDDIPEDDYWKLMELLDQEVSVARARYEGHTATFNQAVEAKLKDAPRANQYQRFGNHLIDSITAFLISVPFIQRDDYLLWWLLIYVGYYTLCEYFWQKTLGKLLTKTRVVSLVDERLTFRQALGRSLSRMVPFEPISGLFSASGYKDTWWHDKWSKALVVSDGDLSKPNYIP